MVSCIRAWSILAAVVLCACDDVRFGPPEAEGPAGPPPAAPTVCDVEERVFRTACASCHADGATSPSFTLEGLVAAVNAPSERYPGAVLVVPGDPEGSLLFRKATGTQSPDEGAAMPIGGALDEAQVSLLETWIRQGAETDCEAAPPDAAEPDDVPPPAVDAGPLPDTVDLCDVTTRLFQAKCTTCHGAGGTSPDLTAAGAEASLVGVESAAYPGRVRVVPGDLDASLLYRKLAGTQADDEGARMPLGGAANEEDLALVARWIEGGALGCGEGGAVVDGDAGVVAPPPAPETDAGPLPENVDVCDVSSRLFQAKCTGCHGAGATAPDLTAAGVLTSLVGVESAAYAGRVRVVAGDPESSLLYRKLAGTQAADEGARMPLGGAASAEDVELVSRWIAAGAPLACDDVTAPPPPPPAPVEPVCSSNSYWTNGDDGSPRMHPGRACISCHDQSDDDDAPDLLVGGTLYPTLHEPDDCRGVDGTTPTYASARVEITDAQGSLFSLPVNSSGNFLLHRFEAPSFTFPFTAKVIWDGRERAMGTPQHTGNCNSCHTTTGRNGAPGRIFLPD